VAVQVDEAGIALAHCLFQCIEGLGMFSPLGKQLGLLIQAVVPLLPAKDVEFPLGGRNVLAAKIDQRAPRDSEKIDAFLSELGGGLVHPTQHQQGIADIAMRPAELRIEIKRASGSSDGAIIVAGSKADTALTLGQAWIDRIQRLGPPDR